MTDKKLTELLKKSLLALIAAGAVWVFFRYLIGWVLPFIIAWVLARLIRPPAELLRRRLRLPRWLAVTLSSVLILAVVLALAGLIVSRVIFELSSLAQRLPELTAGAENFLAGARDRADALAARLPESLRGFALSALSSLTSSESELPGLLMTKLVSILGGIAAGLPDALLLTLTVSLAAFFMALGWDDLREFFMAQLPQRFHDRARAAGGHIRASVLGWLKAQGILTALIFLVLFLGLTLFRVDYALLTAAVIAIVDLLPVLGTGTVLIPWGVLCLIGGSTRLGVSLLILYAFITVGRNLIQPKLVGLSLGLSPLATLAAIYIGYRAMGVGGMIILPVALVVVKKLNDSGLIHLWNET